jgi:uncharacterized protein (DUF983 family)
MDKNMAHYPIIVKYNPVDGDTEAICPNCKEGKVYCGYGYRHNFCPKCGQKITWFKY